MNKKIVAVSGGFDPYGPHHAEMLIEAAQLGDVIVILNSDEWLIRKKGFCFMTFEERKRIMESIKGVVRVEKAIDNDNTVCESLKEIKPDIFCNGGDRKNYTTPEVELCNNIGIELKFGVGGDTKTNSSTNILKRFEDIIRR